MLRAVSKLFQVLMAVFIASHGVVGWGATSGVVAGYCTTESTVLSNNYLGACGYQQSTAFSLSQATTISRIRIWYDFNRGGSSLNVTITGPNGYAYSSATTRGGCYTNWCEGMIALNATLPAGTYTVATNSNSVCADPSGKTTLVLYGCAPVPTQSFDVSPMVSGAPSALTLSLEVAVASPDIGSQGSIFLGAFIPPDTILLNNGATWLPYLGGNIPAYFTGVLPSKRTIPLFNAVDVRPLAGIGVFAGYGHDGTDMLNRNLIKVGYTFPVAAVGGTDDVKLIMDDMLGMVSAILGGGLSQQLTPILQALMSSTASTCPRVISNLTGSIDLSNLVALPSPTVISLDYGTGCLASDGTTRSGKTTITLSNLRIDDATGISATFTMVFDQAKSNGVLLGNGTLGGSISGLSLSSTAPSGNGNLSFTNFTMPNGQTFSGTATLNMTSAEAINLAINVSSNTLTVNLPLVASKVGDELILRSPSAGSVNGYAVNFNSVVYNGTVCPSRPIGGSVSFSKNGQTSTATFPASCTGTYVLR